MLQPTEGSFLMGMQRRQDLILLKLRIGTRSPPNPSLNFLYVIFDIFNNFYFNILI